MPIDAQSHRHLERLRDIARSAGWPCHDSVELDLLAAGLIRRAADAHGRETLQVVEGPVCNLAVVGGTERTLQDRPDLSDLRRAIAQALVTRLQRDGHVVWRDLRLDGAACDVYAVRQTSVEAYLHPVAHLIHTSPLAQVSDALTAEAGAACIDASSRCWCVLGPEVTCDVDREIARHWGVMRARLGAGPTRLVELTVERPAPQRALRLPVRVWVSLARSIPVPPRDSTDRDAQALLAEAHADLQHAPLR